MANVGISELARQLKVGKGTLSKQAKAGKIPVAERDANGNPLFDVDEVRKARDNNLNPLMRREIAERSEEAEDDDGGEQGDLELPERRSPSSPGTGPRPPSALVEQQKLEKQLKNRRLLRQLGEDEGLFVLKGEVESAYVTIARQTRDTVTGQLADYAGKLYAYVSQQPRSDAELRIWLSEHAGLAFDQAEKALAAEQDDEFDDGESEPSAAASH